MKILSVDTSSSNCSVAIIEFNKSEDDSTYSFNILAEENSNDEKTHSQKLMPLIDKVFSDSKLSLNDINLLACCVGPGSFTGIRIGIATIKAFCDSRNIPAVGATSLESLSFNATCSGIIFPIIDAKNSNVYCAGYNVVSNTSTTVVEPFADNIDNSLEKIKSFVNGLAQDIYFIGNGAFNYKDLIEEKFNGFNNLNIHFIDNNEQSAISLSKCAINKYLEGSYGDSSILSPIYLRKSQAERIADGEKK